jgi:hypothetical protein
MIMQSIIPAHNYSYGGVALDGSSASGGGNGGDRTLTLNAVPGTYIIGGGGHGGTDGNVAQCNTSGIGNLDSVDNTCESCMFAGYRTAFTSSITCEGRGNASDAVAYAAAGFIGTWVGNVLYDFGTTSNHGSGAVPNPNSVSYPPRGVVVTSGTSAINDGATDGPSGSSEIGSINGNAEPANCTTTLAYWPSQNQYGYSSRDPGNFQNFANGAGAAYIVCLQPYPYGHFGSN